MYFNSEKQNINKKIQKTAFYNIYDLAKHDFVLGGVTLVGKHRRQTVLLVGHQVVAAANL